jgi:hypothetical protein
MHALGTRKKDFPAGDSHRSSNQDKHEQPELLRLLIYFTVKHRNPGSSDFS